MANLQTRDSLGWNTRNALNRWNGSAWVSMPLYVWDGSKWLCLTLSDVNVRNRLIQAMAIMHQDAFNPNASPVLPTVAPAGYPPAGVPGGLYISWKGTWDGVTNPSLNTNYTGNGVSGGGGQPQNVAAASGGGVGHTYAYKLVAIAVNRGSIPSDASNTVTASTPINTVTWESPIELPFATAYAIQRSTDGGSFLTLAAAGASSGTTTTGSSAAQMVDNTQAWTTNQWAGMYAIIRNNTAFRGRYALIISNTATTLTFDSGAGWPSAPADGSLYSIVPAVTSPFVDAATLQPVTQVNDVTESRDSTIDIRYLRNLCDFRQLTGTTSYDDHISAMTPAVYEEWFQAGYYRSWPYFEMLRLHTRQPMVGWLNACKYFANTVYNAYYDPAIGAIRDTYRHTPPIYVVNYAAATAAMLADAGARFGIPGWSTAGSNAADYLVAHAFHPTTGLPAGTMNLNYPSADTTSNSQIRAGSLGEILDNLLRVYQITGTASILTAVKKCLNVALANQNVGAGTPTGWWDTANEGLYFSIKWDGTGLATAYKEAGRQGTMLQALNRLVAVDPTGVDWQGNTWRSWRNRQLDLVLNRFWLNDAAQDCLGWQYRTEIDFSPYDNGTVVEFWSSGEAMGISMAALLDHLLGAV